VPHKKLQGLFDEVRKVLPIFRGGTGLPGAPSSPFGRPEARKPIVAKPLPRVKVMQPAEQAELQARIDEQRQQFIGPILGPTITPQTEMINMATTGDDMIDELLDAGVSEDTIRMIALDIEDQVSAMTPVQRRQRARAINESRQFSRQNLVPAPKKKKKVSAYSKRFGIELKKLKKLHPRTKITALMKRAHRRTRAAMKKK